VRKSESRLRSYSKALLPGALFLLGLVTYSMHWLTAPPGIGEDASRLGIYALDFVQEGLFPFYLYHQFAPHPFIVYIHSLLLPILGYDNGVLRGVTIVGGALATPAIFWASCLFFEEQGSAFARRAGLIAAVGLGLSTFFASFSRWGVEAALLPFVELLAIAFLWRGLKRGRKADFILAGMFVGLSQYIYIVARFFPVALAVASIGALLANRLLLARWRGLVMAASLAVLVALPQLILFVTHPYTLFARIRDPGGHLSPQGQFLFELPNPVSTLVVKLANQLLMLAWHWDHWYNALSYKPLLTPILSVCLVAGVTLALFRRRDVFVFSFLMMVMMLLPELLTYEGNSPTPTRIVPALPFIYIMAGSGGATIWAWLERSRHLPRWFGGIVLLLVVASGLLRQWDFATRVKPDVLASDRLEWHNNLIEIALAEFISNHPETPIIVPNGQFQFEPFAFLLSDQFPKRKSGMDAPLTKGETVTVIEPRSVRLATTEKNLDEWVLLKDRTAYFLPPLDDSIEALDAEESAIVASNGVVVAKAFTARWQGASPQFVPHQASFANGMDLVGYQSSILRPGNPLWLTYYWQPDYEIERDVELFVQLFDQNREAVVANSHIWPLRGVFRMRAWQPGQIMPLSHSLSIPDNLGFGPYQLRVGLLDLLSRERIHLESGRDLLHLKTFKIPLPPDSRVPETPADISFGEIIRLEGYTLSAESDRLTIVFFWKAINTPPVDYTSFVHIVDSDDNIVAQADMEPLGGQYPTSIWSPDESIVDERTIPGLPKGEFQVLVGWYRHEGDGWERLSIVSGGLAQPDNRAVLDTFTLP